MKYTLTKVSTMGLLVSALFFAGCSLEIPGMETSEKTITKVVTVTVTPSPESKLADPAEDLEVATPEPTVEAEVEVEAEPEVQETPTAEDTTNAEDTDFDAKVAAAVENYIANNKEAFGKNVIESANAYQAIQQAEAEAQKSEAVKNVPGVSAKDHLLGDKDAPFVLFEYSDYQCPFCQRFHPTSKEFIEKNKDVALVFRAMPLDQLHPKARGIHEVAECVAEQAGNDAFWKFSDAVFEKEVTSNTDYQAAATKAGVTDLTKLAECVTAETYKQRVADSSAEGASLGIQGTPTSILKNTKTGEVRLIGGAYPLEALESALAELK